MKSAFCAVLFLASIAAAVAADGMAHIVVQNSPIAGFQYYDGKTLWDEMKAGDPLALVREPGNPHDANAIRLEWKGRKLGYVPRRENSDLARQMDRGAAVESRITELRKHPNGRNLISYEIFVPLSQRPDH